jgi:hypothetical protein
MRRLALALALSVLAGPALAGPGYVGVWALDRATCRASTEDGDQKIYITPRAERGYEYRCRYLTVTPNAGGWNIKASCFGEGETTIEHSNRVLNADGSVTVTNAYGSRRFVRCR